ncbi:ABC transporter permease [Pseudobacteroides cellulosolvens]|uniref:MacB-like periplasmic core domain containing protein n=1 Tax=Pseudobacteroides cellulosolvens ATCC 35603 = DSM 2933 TaxID=398512 RepID=A0A0L6JRL4_9FIRM|nr:ABC transporter permease [Pseudobacteroides cellulosolvens]KNY28423.1 MacB-like periplasmic core domain containing protein [Pseudobacteroides cellulosolvens ATCC 35603 = DSM 2933]
MGLLQAYKMAIKSILSNKVRSFLTMLGVIIGVGSVIAAVAFAQGSTKSITDSLQGLGTNLISISITGRNSNRNITYDDLKKFSEENSSEIAAVAPQVSSSVTVKVGTKTRDTSMVGTSPEYETIRNVHVQSGRFLLSFDLDYRQKVAIIGTAVANDVFEGVNPIGQTIKINGQIYKVVGLLEQKAGGQDQSEDDQVIIPVTSAQRLSRSAVIRNFSVQAAAPEAVTSVMDKLNAMLQKIYNNTSSYRVFNQEQMLSTLNNITGIMMLVLGGIAAISLLVGGIGIMNIMLVSVTERTREIGIRKAIGAKRRSILVQFMIEAAMVTGIGGIIGVLMGLGIIKFVIGNIGKFNSSFAIQPVYSLEWILISFGISLVTGIVFGLFPAYKAAKLNPIQALRFE